MESRKSFAEKGLLTRFTDLGKSPWSCQQLLQRMVINSSLAFLSANFEGPTVLMSALEMEYADVLVRSMVFSLLLWGSSRDRGYGEVGREYRGKGNWVYGK